MTPQVGSVGFSIDMVVEGEGGRRLAIECDGDRYHGPNRWADDMRRQRILERVGWTFWRCFGSNYSLDPEGVFGDLLATLERMKIYPVEREAMGRGFSEHRTQRAKPAEVPPGEPSSASDIIPPFVLPGEQETAGTQEPESQLREGDRVIIRYLDVEPSRPEFYTISTTDDDRINGYLLVTSPLGQALAGGGSPGDELTFLEGGRERAFLFVSLETASAQAA